MTFRLIVPLVAWLVDEAFGERCSTKKLSAATTVEEIIRVYHRFDGHHSVSLNKPRIQSDQRETLFRFLPVQIQREATQKGCSALMLTDQTNIIGISHRVLHPFEFSPWLLVQRIQSDMPRV